MKQTLYEKIKTIVESWNMAICQFDNWDYILFSSMFYRWEGKTPYVRSSNRTNDINNCYQSSWVSYETRYNIDKQNLKYIWIYERPLWRPKVGDKVQIMYWVYKWKIWECVYDEDWLYCVVEISHEIGKWIYSPWQVSLPYDCIAPRVEISE